MQQQEGEAEEVDLRHQEEGEEVTTPAQAM